MLSAVSCASEAERSSRLRALAEDGIDPPRVFGFSGQGRIGPFLYERLRRVPGLPCEVVEPLAQEASAWTRSALAQARDILLVLGRFETAGIETLVYKGPHLAERLFGGLGRRHFRDVDLLVRRRDVAEAVRILIDLGFRREDGGATKPDFVSTSLLHRDCELEFIHPESKTLLELHWDVSHPRSRDVIEVDALWFISEPGRLLGKPIRVLPAEELWMVLAIHGGEKHRWERLKWVLDLSRIPGSAEGFDWVRLRQLARDWDRERLLLHSLALTRELTGLWIPAPFRDAIERDPEIAALVAMSRGRLFGGEHAPMPGYAEWEHYFRRDCEHNDAAEKHRRWPSWRARLRYLRTLLEPGWLERFSLPLPRALRFLHWIYRPIRLGWKYRAGRRSD